MEEASVPRVTGLLHAWRSGNREALDRLMPIVYEELRKIALSRMRQERCGHTLQPTALVNEAYMRLVGMTQTQWQDRAHFFAMSSELMRRILVDHARLRGYKKRGGGAQRVTLEEPVEKGPVRAAEVLDLDNALNALEKLDARKAQIAQLRFFGGLNVDETAAVLCVSPETVYRDWKFSKAWLARRLATSVPKIHKPGSIS